MTAPLDLIIIGAGAAGIAAARRAREAGLSFRVLEARNRIGGRAHTVEMLGTPVDLGAHWMHMADHNPLIPLGNELGVSMIETPDAFPYYVAGKRQTRAETVRLRAAWEETERNAIERASASQDLSVAECLPDLGDWTDSIAFNHGLYSGRAVEEISAFDYARVEDSDNRFPRGGYGALVARLADGLPIALGAAVTRIGWSGSGVSVEGTFGTIEARAAIVAVPVTVLAAGGIAFTPPLPQTHRDALASFMPAAYDHVILHWRGSPFDAGADQLTLFKGERARNISMLVRIEGSDLHYVEIGGSLMTAFAGTAEERNAFAASAALGELTRHFGIAATRGIEIVHVTNWWDDRFSLGSWSVLPPGKALSREAMQRPVATPDGTSRLFFAGEFSSPSQWGTVGGAWLEGTRAADAAGTALSAS